MLEEISDQEFQMWADAAQRSAASMLAAAIGAADGEKQRRAVLSGFACAMVEAYSKHRPTGFSDVEVLAAWNTVGAAYMLQFAAGLTTGKGS